jgi:Mrp family chromosome partitioning ATPase
MGEILCELRNEYDFIVIDTPPVSLLTDAVTLCQFVDGIIFVIRQKTASIDQIKFAMKKLESVKANVIGAILNDYVVPKDSSLSKNYYNNYSDYYQHK